MTLRPAAALTAVLLLCGALLLGGARPAAAHGDSIRLQVTGRADGHPVVVASWENDGDPVTEPVAGTLSALAADGRSVGPWRLVAVPGAEATYTTGEALPAGSWKVTVESGFPALGRAEASLSVAVVADPTAGASRTPSAGADGALVQPPPASSPPSSAGPTGASAPHGGPGGWTTVASIAVAVLAIAALVLAVRLRRRLARLRRRSERR
ncbi:hypothetical protein [Kitasatospora sp. GP82]|uniref:hypothetical protein n=1 Tax=Kitasatospora sp. GP82 TaxID=3035089 RepID=UPI0024764A3C|nr:hypothetical protein [Kitasatospora sp. GP82]MDH6124808.1 hypothetical protein [Kitasatospora sp. GP82]